MAFLVEDGTGLAAANSYVSVANAEAYADDRGLTFTSGSTANKQSALVRATAAIDAEYGALFSGWRANDRSQALEWPREDAYDREDNLIANNEIPDELVEATIEGAVRELATPGSLMPDLGRGGEIKRVRAGSVEVEYSDAASATTVYSLIAGILAPILSRRAAAVSMTGTTTRI